MTPEQFKQARLSLGLSEKQAAKMFGLGHQSQLYNIEGVTQVPGYHARLMQAYLDGYRPTDWPTQKAPAD